MASHGDQESSRADTTLFSNDEIPAAHSPTNPNSISISSSNLSHESGPTNPARSPAAAPPGQLAHLAHLGANTTETWPAWGGSGESASTNQRPIANVNPNAAAPNPQNHDPTYPTNPAAAPNPIAPAHGTPSPRDKRHEASGHTTAAESSSSTLIPHGSTAVATLARPEEPHELASLSSMAAAATVPEDLYQPADTEQTRANIGEGGSTSHSNPQPSSYDSDANTLAGSTIEVESDTDLNTDGDSAYGSDASSFLSSLHESVRNYKYENGRRYHGYEEGRYPVPNDEIEANREDMKHHGTTLLIGGKLQLAPIGGTPSKVLDVGTGTGIWAMEFADAHPTAEVIGVDLSPMQPDMVPPNLQFEIDDVEREWAYRPDSFDFIHIRYMFSAITDWPKLLQQCMSHLKPGGWVEVIEMDIIPSSDDGSLPSDNYITKHLQYLTEAGAKMNRRLDIATHLQGLLADAGFVRVTEIPYKLPMGVWPKQKNLKTIGFFHREQFLEGLQGMAMGFFTRALGWTPQEVEVFLVRVRKDVRDPSFHTYWRTYFVYAQKPLM